MVRRARRLLTYTTITATKSAATGSASASHAIPYLRPTNTNAKPSTTTALDQMSVEKCSASASSAWLSYLEAILPSARERQKSTPMETNITTKAVMWGSI